MARQKQLGGIISQLLKRPSRRRGFYEAELVARWEEIVPDYGRFSKPLKIYKGVLTVATNSGSAAYNMQMQGNALVSRINSYFGYEAVSSLRFINKSFKTKAQKEAIPILIADEPSHQIAKFRCSDIKDSRLRTSLERLGALVAMENKN